MTKYCYQLLLCISLISNPWYCLGDAPIQYDMEKISLEKAKQVFDSGTPAKLYPNAVAAVLASDMKEEDKHKYLLMLFLDPKRMAVYYETANKEGPIVWDSGVALEECGKQLKRPEVFFAEMSEHKMYQPIKVKPVEEPEGYPKHIWGHQGSYLWAMIRGKSVPKVVLEQWFPMASQLDHVEYGILPLLLIAKHGDDTMLGKVLSTYKNWPVHERNVSVPKAIAYRRTSPCIIEFYCGAILISDNSGWLRRCLLSVRKYTGSRQNHFVPNYSKVDPKNAERITKTLDTLIAKKEFLLNHKKEKARWTQEEFERLVRIREQMAKKAEEYKASQEESKKAPK